MSTPEADPRVEINRVRLAWISSLLGPTQLGLSDVVAQPTTAKIKAVTTIATRIGDLVQARFRFLCSSKDLLDVFGLQTRDE